MRITSGNFFGYAVQYTSIEPMSERVRRLGSAPAEPNALVFGASKRRLMDSSNCRKMHADCSRASTENIPVNFTQSPPIYGKLQLGRRGEFHAID